MDVEQKKSITNCDDNFSDSSKGNIEYKNYSKNIIHVCHCVKQKSSEKHIYFIFFFQIKLTNNLTVIMFYIFFFVL